MIFECPIYERTNIFNSLLILCCFTLLILMIFWTPGMIDLFTMCKLYFGPVTQTDYQFLKYHLQEMQRR